MVKLTLGRKDNELAFSLTVTFLDESQQPLQLKVEKDRSGEWLFDVVCEQLGGIHEKDYFGLRYVDKDKQRQWLDLRRNAYKQLNQSDPISVSFRVKHYPVSPANDLKQEIARYFLFLQLKRDLLHGRLICQQSDAIELASYIVQAEFGDHEDQETLDKYLSNVVLVHNQTPKLETKIMEAHKALSGLVPSDVEARFLEKASKMDTYGIDPYAVKDQKGNNLFIGLTHQGVVTFQGSRRTHLFKWDDITKFNFEGKLYIIHVTYREDTPYRRKKRHVLGFKCDSRQAAVSLWKWSYDRQSFFTLTRSSEARTIKSRGGLLLRSNSYRFSGRSQQELFHQSMNLSDQPQPSFERNSLSTPLLMRKNTMPLQRTNQFRSSLGFEDKFNTLPRNIKLKPINANGTVNSENGQEDAIVVDHPDGIPTSQAALEEGKVSSNGDMSAAVIDESILDNLIVHREEYEDIVEVLEEEEDIEIHEEIISEKKILSTVESKPLESTGESNTLVDDFHLCEDKVRVEPLLDTAPQLVESSVMQQKSSSSLLNNTETKTIITSGKNEKSTSKMSTKTTTKTLPFVLSLVILLSFFVLLFFLSDFNHVGVEIVRKVQNSLRDSLLFQDFYTTVFVPWRDRILDFITI